jgi:hypothetical protein
MGQPGTAAGAVAGIFAGLAVIFFGYKAYVKWHHHRVRKLNEQTLPPIREPPPAYVSHGGGGSPYAPPSTIGTLYGETWRSSWRGSSGKGSPGGTNASLSDMRRLSSSGLLVASPTGGSSHYGLSGVATPAAESSAPGSPLSPAADFLPPQFPGEAHEAHLRNSSSSSTNALQRSYAGSIYSHSNVGHGSSGGQSYDAQQGPPPRRHSYLPHLPSNRESIHIVPPQPLGFGLGGLAQAVDQKTLAFSKGSGIGDGDEFTTGLVWEGNDGSGGANDFGAAGGSAAAAARMREMEHARYLAQGPVRSASNTTAGAAGEGWSTPDHPSSRSLSPAQLAGSSSLSSSSDAGSSPRPTRRAPASSSRDPVLAKPLPSQPGGGSRSSHTVAASHLQSPLQLVSQGAAPYATADRSTPPSLGSHGGSPIIGAFRSSPSGGPLSDTRGSTPVRSAGTPELASRSDSGTGGSSRTTASSSIVDGAVDVPDELALRGRSFAVGKDGQLHMTGAAGEARQAPGVTAQA